MSEFVYTEPGTPMSHEVIFSIAIVLLLATVTGCASLPSSHVGRTSANASGAAEGSVQDGRSVKTMEHSLSQENRRLVICLDGTWNGTYVRKQRLDGESVVKPSNVLKMARAIVSKDASGRDQIVYYDIGVGSLAKDYPGFTNRLLGIADKTLGGGWGAGFEGNIEDALNFLALNYTEGDDVFVFGFSRGAATARGLTQFIDWAGGLPVRQDAYYLPELFRRFVLNRGATDSATVVREINDRRRSKDLTPLEPFVQVNIEYLGVWDTVMALGGRFKATDTHTSDVSRSFYVVRTPSAYVRHARQALAIDEQRWDFRPEIWTGSAPGQILEQRWFAGVHSNIGGGYVDDGMANIAFHWILDGAKDHGLAIDKKFAAFYSKYFVDVLYDSYTWYYRLLDTARFRVNAGTRPLVGRAAEANLSVDKSVIQRIMVDAQSRNDDGTLRYPDTGGHLYRPENVFEYLACIPDLNAYFETLGLDVTEADLPGDVRQILNEYRDKCA